MRSTTQVGRLSLAEASGIGGIITAARLSLTAAWVDAQADRIEWIRPDAGAICCVRLRDGAFDDAAVNRFYSGLEKRGIRVANGTWFGDEDRVFRLGFGLLPVQDLEAALAGVSAGLDKETTMHVTRRFLLRSMFSPERHWRAIHLAVVLDAEGLDGGRSAHAGDHSGVQAYSATVFLKRSVDPGHRKPSRLLIFRRGGESRSPVIRQSGRRGAAESCSTRPAEVSRCWKNRSSAGALVGVEVLGTGAARATFTVPPSP